MCDVTGFAASTFMRGVRFGFAASTLLAQVDASVGGKNGVNFLGYKNIVGVFRQPDFVICDPAMLATLPQSEAANGLAEVVKHGAIGDADLFCFLEQFSLSARELEPSAVERMVAASVTLKAAVVRKDEQEAGQRRILNFGHTLGHALEKVTGMSHGEAVSVGMVAAARLSVEQGLLPASEAHRIERLLDALGLPTSAAADAELLAEAMGKDKKREGKRIHMVLIRRIGEAVVQTVDAGDAALLIQR